MPTLVNCPSCERKLRVPDELLGQKVKCPSCATTFDAVAASLATLGQKRALRKRVDGELD